MKTCADIMEILSADFTVEYERSFIVCKGYSFFVYQEAQVLARRMQMISLAAIMIYEGRW